MPVKIILLFAIMLCSLLTAPSYFAATHAQSAAFTIDLSFVPSQVEAGKTSHQIGYVRIISHDGLPVYATRDIQVELQSEDETVASVPGAVVIPSGSDHAKFNVSVTDTVGVTEISAFFGDQIVTENFRVVAPQSQVPQDVDLVINLPSEQMQIGSEMPFSVYLENNGTLLQAPADITVSFDYERPLIKLNSDRLVIEKGSYYSIGTVRALEKSGSAFIKATTSEPLLNTVANLQIAQTQPAAIKVDVFPDDIGPGENTIDVFVSLLDSEGSSTLAAQDVRLELFANSTGVLNLGQINAVIDKGSFGLHQRLSVRSFTEQNVEFGASASGLGVDTDTFAIVAENLQEGHPKAQVKALQVFTVSEMPSEGTSVVVYQLNAVETDDDDNTDINGDGSIDGDDSHPIDDLEDGELYPIQASKLFSREQGNLFVVSSDNSAARIVDYGTLPAGRSYGAATISSGRQTDSVEVSVSLAEGASGTGSMNIKGGLNPVQTLIFSPAGKAEDGNYRMLFNQEGYSDLFFIARDSEGRPAASENGVKYLVKPINELAEIEAGNSFGALVVRSSAFGSDDDGLSQITASPVGVNANSNLEAKSDLHLIFFAGSVSKVMFPFDSVIGVSKSHDVGTVQLLDSFGNPLVPSVDLVARLSSSNPAIIKVPDTVIIKQETSYVQFSVTTFGKAGNVTISASVEGVQSSSLELSSALLKIDSQILVKERLRATVPGNVTISAIEGATVLWGVPSSLEVKIKEDKALRYDPETNSYFANLQVVASKPGNYTIDATLLKDGFETTRLSEHVFIDPYVSELQIYIEYSEDAIAFKQPTPIVVTVETENGQPVEGAIVKLNSRNNATAVPASTRTDSSGTATFTYTVTGMDQKMTLSATATKEGYSDGEDTKELDVTGVPTSLPFWATYAAIAGVLASIGGGVIYFLKRPKAGRHVDEEVEEDEEET